MKLMFVISKMQYGGAERVMANLINSFSENNHQIVLVSAYEYKSVYYLKDNIKLYYSKNHEKGNNRIMRALGFVSDLRRYIRIEKPEAVISFLTDINIMVIPACRLENIPVIVSERNDPMNNPTSRIKRIGRKIIYPFSNGFVFQTKEVSDFFSKKIKKKSTVIANPILTDQLPMKYCGKRKHKFVSVGRLEKQKNHELLIKAFAMLVKKYPEAELHIYGQGSLKKSLEMLIKSLEVSGNVYLDGSKNNILQIINDAYAFVLSSDFEGMPNALMEAMACGLACISTDCPCGGSRMLIKHRVNGILVKTGDVMMLYESMIELLEDEDMCRELGNEALKVRTAYDVSYINTLWLNYIQKIINGAD